MSMSESSETLNGTQPVPLLDVQGLEQRFGGIVAVSDMSLSVARGEVHGIIGPNGAGKTTLFDCIAGLRPPTSGTITLEGRDVTRTSAVKRARLGLRRTFQRQQVFGWLSVEDNVLLAMEWRGGGGGLFGDAFRLPGRVKRERDRRTRVDIALDRCGLTKVRDESAGGLSIGALRRVELARAIVDEPCLLLLDEPTSGLEDSDIDQLGGILQDLRSRGTCGTLLIEHHVPFAIQHCDRISVLELGRKIASGTPDEVMEDESVREAYLA
jgi:branched-chain amino acid transport system ATP-binding protein